VNGMSIAPARTDGLADWIAPRRTALLMIDMQVDFAAPDGAIGRWGMDLSAVPAALAAAERLADAARAAGAPVIFVGLMTSPKTDSPAWSERMRRLGNDPEGDSGLCRISEPGADFYGPKPAPGETVVPKTRYSGFHDTPLDLILKRLKVDTIVACGLTTECCIDCTVRDAFHLDYHVFIPEDACAAYEPDLHAGALKSLELNCAIIVKTDDVVNAWTESVSRG
jgi:ureidoacrylate peracid hydrolase